MKRSVEAQNLALDEFWNVKSDFKSGYWIPDLPKMQDADLKLSVEAQNLALDRLKPSGGNL
ncbi:MAG TPA: hypothetical protein VD816_16610 [Ohtaekwangia sp.]|nr:hypothetical protein [Ohtaekwangia sp.]